MDFPPRDYQQPVRPCPWKIFAGPPKDPTRLDFPGVAATVDGWNPANQLRLVVYPIIYRVLYIPGGAGFQPSTVVSGRGFNCFLFKSCCADHLLENFRTNHMLVLRKVCWGGGIRKIFHVPGGCIFQNPQACLLRSIYVNISNMSMYVYIYIPWKSTSICKMVPFGWW